LLIIVNGEPREIEAGSILASLVNELALKPEQIAIELNHLVVRRSQWQETVLRENDKIEIVHFVGGG
jgi:thiamine biosynthesis protein ThiS